MPSEKIKNKYHCKNNTFLAVRWKSKITPLLYGFSNLKRLVTLRGMWHKKGFLLEFFGVLIVCIPGKSWKFEYVRPTVPRKTRRKSTRKLLLDYCASKSKDLFDNFICNSGPAVSFPITGLRVEKNLRRVKIERNYKPRSIRTTITVHCWK